MYPVMSRYATHAQSVGQLQPVVCRFFDFCLFPNRFWIYRQADNDNFLFIFFPQFPLVKETHRGKGHSIGSRNQG